MCARVGECVCLSVCLCDVRARELYVPVVLGGVQPAALRALWLTKVYLRTYMRHSACAQSHRRALERRRLMRLILVRVLGALVKLRVTMERSEHAVHDDPPRGAYAVVHSTQWKVNLAARSGSGEQRGAEQRSAVHGSTGRLLRLRWPKVNLRKPSCRAPLCAAASCAAQCT